MQKSRLVFFIGGSLVLLSSLTGCGVRFNGTETGNALTTSPAYTTILMGPEFVGNVCAAIQSCVPQPANTCYSTLANQAGLPSSFGVPSSAGLSTMTEVFGAEYDGHIEANGLNADACISGLRALPCTSTAWQPMMTSGGSGLAHTADLLSHVDACSHVYAK